MSPDQTPRVEIPRVLTDLDDRVARSAPDESGALWRLAESGRQLDANLVRLPPGTRVGEHAENDLDVLLLVVAGGGEVEDGLGGRQALVPKALVWLPRTSRRALRAGPEGLVYLTVHRRRPGMGVGMRPLSAERAAPGGEEGGEGPCMLDRVCPACGRMNERPGPGACERCGEPLPAPGSV
ncbi:cupin domain-containing protein [Streptomyces sp. CNQ085]|uniref:cupin domain-containing protein n=1 Tax=Streptomyces sp. CNQ085 TaxID=2886944 RepID=UPI001F50F15B|nr:cupin domain-containing protein [Streptomyces sp. CNQ085]MCI0383062.1 cupin domain-containing protein [Streptomyces sp. CNQ085]